jgi:hypothetical protein
VIRFVARFSRVDSSRSVRARFEFDRFGFGAMIADTVSAIFRSMLFTLAMCLIGNQ